MPKRFIVPMAALAVLAAGAYGATQASAATDTASDHRTTLIQKLADALHVDKSKVQAVFDQNKAENQANREKKYEDRLNQAVTDGKLTADQKSKVLAEHNKLQAEIQSAVSSSSTPADHRAAMEKIRTAAQDWSTQNNIDAKWLLGGGPRMGMGHRGGFGHGPGEFAHHEMD